MNITQIQPEIPQAGEAPQRVTDTPVSETPYSSPVVITSQMAKDRARKQLEELSRLTGTNYTI